MKPILIDHDDSFTHILAQYIGELTAKLTGETPTLPTVLNHSNTSLKEIREHNPSHIILSPGPGTALKKEDFAIGNEILDEYASPNPNANPNPNRETQIPILGVCLGHQGIASHFGAKITHAPEVMHGKRSQIFHNKTGIFKDIPSPFTAMRYHSLAITNLPSKLEILAQTKSNNGETIMAIRHKNLPIFGVQFHPESIGTEHGKKLLENFLSTQPKVIRQSESNSPTKGWAGTHHAIFSHTVQPKWLVLAENRQFHLDPTCPTG